MRCALLACVLLLLGCDTAAGSMAEAVRPVAATVPAASVPAASVPASVPASDLDAMPWGPERVALEQRLALEDDRFLPHTDEGGRPLLDAGESLTARFDASGAHLSIGEHELSLRASAIGRRDHMTPLPTGAPSVIGAEVRTARGADVTEWWRALPSGLEHGLTIDRAPGTPGELVVELAIEGNLTAHASPSEGVELRTADGARIATYAHLFVLDADDARIPARMAVADGHVEIVIDDTDARYPLLVDPFVATQEANLVYSSGGGDQFGASVDITDDGTRAVVGGPLYAGSLRGTTRVYLRTGSSWAVEHTVPSGGTIGSRIGTAVAISGNGTRMLSNNMTLAGGGGGIEVYVRSGTTWSVEHTFTGTPSTDTISAVLAIDAGGTRALVGRPRADTGPITNHGSVEVWVRAGTAWTLEATLLAADREASDSFGSSVAFSGDGTRVIVGVPNDDITMDEGGARIFVRSGTTWTEEANLVPTGAAANSLFGGRVDLDGDGSRAIVRGPTQRIYVRTGTTWAAEATLSVTALDVALSADGSRALIGGSERVAVYVRAGSAWGIESTFSGPDTVAGDLFGTAIAVSDPWGRVIAGAPGDAAGQGSARIFTVPLASGSICLSGADCPTGFCVDGFCCATACAGGAADCQACSAALTGGADGTCAPLSAAIAPTVTCRATAGTCDTAEVCASTSTVCPADVVSSAVTVCRASAGACDVAETCSGSVGTCPIDTLLPSTSLCRASLGVCDVAESCTGIGPACPTDIRLTTVCRPAMGMCDAPDFCDGVSFACPLDAPEPSGNICRPQVGFCDVPERCSGTSTTCPGDDLASPGAVCRPATSGGCDAAEVCNGVSSVCPGDGFSGAGVVCRVPAGTCDVVELCSGASPLCPPDLLQGPVLCRAAAGACDPADVCTGSSPVCPDTFAPDTTPCGAAPSDICDAPDHCAGTSADCVAEYLVGVSCRAAAGACDLPEVCLGDTPACPPDAIVSADVSCRASTDPSCDPEEACDGAATSCPADVITCAPVDAGGIDAASGSDAGASDSGASDAAATDAAAAMDAGTAPPAALAGCACRTRGGSSTPVPLAFGVALAFVSCWRRRRRAFAHP